jgi:hypothetical protein
MKLAPAGHWVWPGRFRRKWLISGIFVVEKEKIGLTTKSQRHEGIAFLEKTPKNVCRGFDIRLWMCERKGRR